MATFEELKLVMQSHQNFENLRRDMRANAQAYLDAVTANKPTAAIIAIANANTAKYQERLAWALTAWNDLAIRAKIQSGLAALSLLQAELTGTYTDLKTAADAETTAEVGMTTAAQLQTMATATLTAIPAHVTIWPNG